MNDKVSIWDKKHMTPGTTPVNLVMNMKSFLSRRIDPVRARLVTVLHFLLFSITIWLNGIIIGFCIKLLIKH